MKLGNLLMGLLAACSLAAAAPASATLIHLSASLDCAQANGGVGTCGLGGSGTGTATVSFDDQTSLLSWSLVHGGLSTPVIAAHFHGPALPSQNANITVGIGTANPAVGSETLSASEAADLLAELWYVNVHSTAFTGGEIRGQVLLPEPSLAALAGLGALALLRRRRERSQA